MAAEEQGPVKEMIYEVLPERMPGIAEDRMSAEQRAVVADLVASRGGFKGSFPALVRSPQFMDRVQKLGAYVRFEASLDLRVNRVASLLTTRHWSNQYEWSGNTGLALKAGLGADIIEAIGEGRRPARMAADEEAAYDFVTELLTNKSVSDPTYARAVEKFGERGVIDLMGVVGYYGMLAMVMNVVRTPVTHGTPMPLAPMPQMLRPKR